MTVSSTSRHRMTWRKDDVAFARPQGTELLARVYRAEGQATGRCRPSSTCMAARGRGSIGPPEQFSAAGSRPAESWSSRSTSAWAPITSTRRRARTWPRGCAGCAPTQGGWVSIPRAWESAAARAGPPRLASRRRAQATFHEGTPASCQTGRSIPPTVISAWPSRWWRTRSAIPWPDTATCSPARTSRRSPPAPAPAAHRQPTMASFEMKRTWPR